MNKQPVKPRLAEPDVRPMDRLEIYEAALYKIARWADSYPFDFFPEPDLLRARGLLAQGGINLDAISANARRQVVEGLAEIAREALVRAPLDAARRK